MYTKAYSVLLGSRECRLSTIDPVLSDTSSSGSSGLRWDFFMSFLLGSIYLSTITTYIMHSISNKDLTYHSHPVKSGLPSKTNLFGRGIANSYPLIWAKTILYYFSIRVANYYRRPYYSRKSLARDYRPPIAANAAVIFVSQVSTGLI